MAAYYGDDYYSLLKERDYKKLYNNSMKKIADIIPSLSVCLLEDYNEGYVSLLPEKLQTLIKYFHNMPVSDEITDCFGAYNTILLEVVSFATEEVAQKYLAMLEVFSKTDEEKEEKLVAVADKLMTIQKYEIVNALYQQVSPESPLKNEWFWQKDGICLYGLGQYQEAMESLKLAGKNRQTDTYKIWCQEAMENGI